MSHSRDEVNLFKVSMARLWVENMDNFYNQSWSETFFFLPNL